MSFCDLCNLSQFISHCPYLLMTSYVKNSFKNLRQISQEVSIITWHLDSLKSMHRMLHGISLVRVME